MRIVYFDCSMGAAGDMIGAALLELLPDKEDFVDKMNSFGIPGVEYRSETVSRCGINGTRLHVVVDGEEEGKEHGHDHEHHEHMHDHEHEHEHEHDHHHDHHHEHEHEHGYDHEHGHHHASLADIEKIVQGLDISEKVRSDVMNIYKIIAEAESHAHGVDVSEIHFHEVGTMDAIADITAVCALIEELAPDKIIASAVNTGSGTVKCAHGILPVPAPATAYILKDVPMFQGEINTELCTPTGAALIKYFADDFGTMPAMRTEECGYGMGTKEFETANCLRAFYGESVSWDDDDVKERVENGYESGAGKEYGVYELSCNMDDMTGEQIGFAARMIYDAGAVEVFTVPIGMKKSRPGIMLVAIAREDDREEVARAIFKHTSTIGVREKKCERYVLDRHIETVETKFGNIRKKISEGYGTSHSKYEYDDLADAAVSNGMSIPEILNKIDNIE